MRLGQLNDICGCLNSDTHLYLVTQSRSGACPLYGAAGMHLHVRRHGAICYLTIPHHAPSFCRNIKLSLHNKINLSSDIFSQDPSGSGVGAGRGEQTAQQTRKL